MSDSVNRGKQFEEQIRKGFLKVPDTNVIRLQDPMAGYAGIRNICDFVVYHHPYQYLIECKSCHGNTLPYTNITDNQYSGLLNVSRIRGIVAGFMIWFIDKDVTLFVDADCLDVFRKEHDAKSFRFDDRPFNCIEITGQKRRVLFDYDMHDFIEKIEER